MPDELAQPTPPPAPKAPAAPPPAQPAARYQPPPMRRFGDYDATRKAVFANAMEAARNLPAVENSRYALTVHDVGFHGPDSASYADHKRALYEGRTLGRRLIGTLRLTDKASGAVVDARKLTLASVPVLTSQGVFVLDGTASPLSHQQRLAPGAYVRRKSNGQLESHLPFLPGEGVPHRFFLDPESGQIKTQVGQAELPAHTLMKALGATDEEIAAAWGPELAADNAKASRPHHLEKYWEKMGPGGKQRPADLAGALRQHLETFKFDPWVTARTLGAPLERYGKDAALRATGKLVKVARGEAEPDDRDNPAYSVVWGPEHLIAERITRSRPLLAKALWQATNKGSLKGVQPGLLTPGIRALFSKSGLGQSVEGTNNAEFLDHGARITKVGEGGIGRSADSVPASARNVNPGQFLFIDPIRASESENIGVDLRVAFGTRLGADRQMYAPVLDPKTNRILYRSPRDLADATVAFPGWRNADTPLVPAIQKGKMTWVRPEELDYAAPSMEQSFSPLTNLVPIKSASKPHRASMGARYIVQALPLDRPEAPLVRTQVPNQPGKSFEELFGRHMGAVISDKPGVVSKLTPDGITVAHGDGTTTEHPLYNWLPSGRKTGVNHFPLVQQGQQVGPGHVLARSGFTDENGHAAYGANLRTAFASMGGHVYEDSVLVSQSAANRLSSSHLYQHHLPLDEHTKTGVETYLSAFPGKYPLATFKNFDPDGVIKPGTKVESGHPLVLGVRKRLGEFGRLSKSGKAGLTDASQTWDHEEPGVVTDVSRTPQAIKVSVHSVKPLKDGDKVSGRHGNKGVVVIRPDHRMPTDAQGRPVDVILSSLGTINRANPSAIFEAHLGKIAEKTGKPYVIDDFHDNQNVANFVDGEAKKHNVPFMETLTDPDTGRPIPNVGVGNLYLMKLLHISESKAKGRGLGGYDESGQPLRGQSGKAMRASLGDTHALLSHGATDVLRDLHLYKGQANDTFWQAYMNGYPPPRPTSSKAFDRFLSELKASGVHPVRDGDRLHLTALRDKDVHELAGDREVKNGETLDFNRNGAPVPGGLFDLATTGGPEGCFHRSVQVWTEDGMVPIGELVEKRMAVRVWSYDWARREFVLRPVTNWFNNRVSGLGCAAFTEGGRISSRVPRFNPSTLWATAGHQVYLPDGSKAPIAACGGSLLAAIEKLHPEQEQVLYGTLLGDATLQAGSLRFRHCARQRDYLAFKAAVFANFATGRGIVDGFSRTAGKLNKNASFWTRAAAIFHEAYRICYPQGVKAVTPEWAAKIGPLALACWYMDDGCLRSREKRDNGLVPALCTHGFDRKSVEILRDVLLEKWGFSTAVIRDEKKYAGRNIGWAITVDMRHAKDFLKLVAPYLVDCMRYKLGGPPRVRACLRCATPTDLTSRVCDSCTRDRIVACGAGKIDRPARKRFGSSAAARAWAAGGVPAEPRAQEVYRARIESSGAAIGDVLRVCAAAQPLTLEVVPFEFQTGTGRRYEKTQHAYDIEVDGTHNYFANGILVSNSSWAKIPLHEPVPNPVAEEPIRRLLGLTREKFRGVLSGRETILDQGGPKAVLDALKKIDVDVELKRTEKEARSSRKTLRDDANRKLTYLRTLKAQGRTPADWFLSAVPVLPPVFRPIRTSSFCFHARTGVWTEDGMVPIGTIVRERRNCRVWTYDFATKSLSLQPIVGWHRNKIPGLRGYKVPTPRGRLAVSVGVLRPEALWATPGHQVFQTDGRTVPIGSATSLLAARESFSETQKQTLYGTLLGDGHVSLAGSYYAGHGADQIEYARLKADIFSPLVRGGLKSRPYVTPAGDKRTGAGFSTLVHAELLAARVLCYTGPDQKKEVTPSWLDKVNDLGLAFWFFDDGESYYEASVPVVKFSTQCFSRAGVDLLVGWLAHKWGFRAALTRWNAQYKDRDLGWQLVIRGADARSLMALVAPYATNDVAYKILGAAPAVTCKTCGIRLPVRLHLSRTCGSCVGRLAKTAATSNLRRARRQSTTDHAAEQTAVDNAVVAARESIGSRLPVLRADTRLSVSVEEVPVLGAATNLAFEATQTGYDITVAGNHNYFADGYLVSNSGKNNVIISDPNLLYKDVIETNKALKMLSGQVGDLGDERLAAYDAVKAVMGLGEPVSAKNKERGVKGILEKLLGSSAKFSYLQQKLLGTPADLSGRGQVLPNPDLDMDQIGVPESVAWEVYRPFVVRRLVQAGVPRAEAARVVEAKGDAARRALSEEMEARPVTATRYPALHRYSVMAFRPRLAAGDAIHVNPLITKGYGMDFNGDSCLTDLLIAKVDGNLFLGTFEEFVSSFVVPGYTEKGAVMRYGNQTTVLEFAPAADAQVPTVAPDGAVAWKPVSQISIHTSHGPDCFQVRTDTGLDATFTAHHNFVRFTEDCELVAAKTEQVRVGTPIPYLFGVDTYDPIACLPPGQADMPLSFDTGVWFGHYLGDGSITGRGDTVSQAGIDRPTLELLEKIGQQISPKRAWYEGNGYSVRWTDPGLVVRLSSWVGTGAAGKRVAGWMAAAPADFRRGLVVGFLMAEGSVCGNAVQVECVSRPMLLGFKLVLASLGVHSTVTFGRAPRGNAQATWVLRIGLRNLLELKAEWPQVGKADQFRAVSVGEKKARTGHHDQVPLPFSVYQFVKGRAKAMAGGAGRKLRESIPDRGKVPSSGDLDRYAELGIVPRPFAERLVASLGLADVDSEKIRRWVAVVRNTKVRWDPIRSIEKVERPPVTYDFHVPGVETFCVDGFFVTHNTVTLHVPLTDDAVKEAYEKMLPSKNLYSVSDFKPKNYLPNMEFVQGLHHASVADAGNAPVEFRTRKEALAALKAGKVGFDTRVRILED